MQFELTSLKDVWLVKPDIFYDFRGENVMTFNHQEVIRVDPEFWAVEVTFSVSHKNVLRGIHYNPYCRKLNYVSYGEVYYVVVNCDKESPEYGKWEAFILSDKNRYQLLKSPAYGSAFLTLSDIAILNYVQDRYFDKSNPYEHIMWDSFDIYWPIKEPILSKGDSGIE
jgi:dTDP-4-dehydrorhamnose 3,5-epimerase